LGLGLLLHLSHPNLQLPKNIGHEEMEIWMGSKGGGGNYSRIVFNDKG
jgi:hypothetical protein